MMINAPTPMIHRLLTPVSGKGSTGGLIGIGGLGGIGFGSRSVVTEEGAEVSFCPPTLPLPALIVARLSTAPASTSAPDTRYGADVQVVDCPGANWATGQLIDTAAAASFWSWTVRSNNVVFPVFVTVKV